MTVTDTKQPSPSVFTKIRQSLFSALETKLGSYLTFHRRPLRSESFGRVSSATPTLPPYAVILRGILVTKNDFTIETVLMYKKLFPGAPLIISTLSTAPTEVLKKLEAIPGVSIILSDKTSPVGYGHINDQIACCTAGIKKAEELGATYALLTRVDQRMYANDLYPFLLGLTETFPLAGRTVQKQRIVALGFSTIKYRTYSLNDMFFFGTCSDLRLYWDIAHDTRDIPKLLTVDDWVKNRVCEGYLFTTFLSAVGHDIKNSLPDYWEALGKYFILVDAQDLDWYWLKYARYQEYRDRQYAKLTLGEHVTFKEWLSMARGHHDKRVPTNLDAVPNDTHNASLTLPS